MPPKKNILLMIADDLGQSLNCYGDSAVQTPHIDKLASEGTLFSKAFTSTASCSGSRSVIYTGLHTHESGQYGLNSGKHHFQTFEHVETAPRLFREQLDYFTGVIGKVHVGPEIVYPWERRVESMSRDVSWVADEAGAFFQESKTTDRPFFLTIGWVDPHRTRTRGGFGNDDSFAERVERTTYKPEDVTVPVWINDLPEVRAEIASYYESISRLDQGVGFALAELRNAGLGESTIVIFLSDNGAPFLNSKTTLYDAGVRLPLLIRRPGSSANITNPNLVSFVDIVPTLLDWAGRPDLNTPSTQHAPSDLFSTRIGRSILPILDKDQIQETWDQRVFGSHTFHESTNYYPTRFVRTQRYKYHRNIEWKLSFPFACDLYSSLSWEAIRNSGSGLIGQRPLKSYFNRAPEELYDLDADPAEIDNLAIGAKGEVKDVLEGLRRATEKWQVETRDPWLYRDGVSVLFNKAYLDEGLVIPDRFDFDVEDPGTGNSKAYQFPS